MITAISVVTLLFIVYTVNGCPESCQCNFLREPTWPSTVRVHGCQQSIDVTPKSLANISSNVHTWIFEDVHIRYIARESFAQYELRAIQFENCYLEDIEDGAFELSEIDDVTFRNTTFSSRGPPVIASSEIGTLSFIYCSLDGLPRLSDVSDLIELIFVGNHLSDISVNFIPYPEAIAIIDLTNNQISKMAPEVFRNFYHLSKLTLNDNPLEQFQCIGQLLVERLSLRNCSLKHFLDNDKCNFPRIEYLDLSQNLLPKLEVTAFNKMRSLQFLNLSNNHLVTIDAMTFSNNSGLIELLLDDNPLTSGLSTFKFANTNQFNFMRFSCANCSLSELPVDFFKPFTRISNVNLMHNFLSNISFLISLPVITHLDLSYNRIASLNPLILQKNIKLTTFNLAGNPLLTLDSVSFLGLPSLAIVNATGCNIVQLWTRNDLQLPSIEHLSLQHNPLTTLKISDLDVVSNLKSLDIDEYLLLCTPNSTDISKLLQNRSVSVTTDSINGVYTNSNEKRASICRSDIVASTTIMQTASTIKIPFTTTNGRAIHQNVSKQTNISIDVVVYENIGISGFGSNNSKYYTSFTCIFVSMFLIALLVVVVAWIFSRNRFFKALKISAKMAAYKGEDIEGLYKAKL